MVAIKRALISVSDKTGVVAFAQGLHDLGVEILSTGGTARVLRAANIPVVDVDAYTGFPEMFDGRVKTLHPKIHGGLLARRDDAKHVAQAQEHGISWIDMVVVNLYPFEQTVAKKKVALAEAIENIDIGGPSMLRSAAKNCRDVAVVVSPDRYGTILALLQEQEGQLDRSLLFEFAVEAFAHTARYDTIIATYLEAQITSKSQQVLPEIISMRFEKHQDLRYGENPHQQAAFYAEMPAVPGLSKMKQLHGKELSFNNILDLNAAVEFIKDFKEPAAVVIKHNNPTGIACDAVLSKAYMKAWACDTLSAFGGIIGFNVKVDAVTAKAIAKSGFMECVVAPGFEKAALIILKQKKNVRLLTLNMRALAAKGYAHKKVYGGLLVQEMDQAAVSVEDWRVVTKKKPTGAQQAAMIFGWQAIKHVKSNAIMLVKGTRAVGIGCGQTSRVESVNIAIAKAGKQAMGSVLVSDAFLPKTDNVELAAKAGIKVIIQTGGSIADASVIEAADKAGIAMVMTGVRHFKH